jgi:hypothetical protein
VSVITLCVIAADVAVQPINGPPLTMPFRPADDLTTISGWLKFQGSHVEAVAKSRTYVIFNAAAGQIRNMFKAELRETENRVHTGTGACSESLVHRRTYCADLMFLRHTKH